MRTNRFTLRSAILAGLAITLLLAGPAAAQGRPSLNDVESRVEALETALCDLHPSYTPKPAFCTPTCGCNLGTPYPAGSSCDEVGPGDYEVTEDVTYTASCAGQCGGGSQPFCNDDLDCPPGENCNLGTGSCEYTLPGVIICTSGADCPGTSTCITQFPQGTCSISGGICVNALQCPGGESCDGVVVVDVGTCAEDAGAGLATCESAADCAPGSTCTDLGDGTLICTTGQTCGAAACTGGSYTKPLFSITNVGPPGGPEIATCDATTQTADEANACITAIEADLGAACTTLP